MWLSVNNLQEKFINGNISHGLLTSYRDIKLFMSATLYCHVFPRSKIDLTINRLTEYLMYLVKGCDEEVKILLFIIIV